MSGVPVRTGGRTGTACSGSAISDGALAPEHAARSVSTAGSITGAVKKARSAGGFALKIEVECRSEEEAEEAIAVRDCHRRMHLDASPALNMQTFSWPSACCRPVRT